MATESYLPRIEELQNKFVNITLEEYQRQGFQRPDEEIDQETIDKVNAKKTVKANFELDMMYNKINHISKKVGFKKKGEVDQIGSTLSNQNLINDPDIFNIVSNDKEYKEWKQLTTEEKLQKLDLFITSRHYDPTNEQTDYDEEVIEFLKELVQEGKLYLKKDIEYDKINQRIACIPLVKYQPESNTYQAKSTIGKKNVKKLSQNAVSKIMKKKRG